MEKNRSILIFGESDGENLLYTTLQLMRIGKKLSTDLKKELIVVFLGGEAPDEIEKAYGYGADKVYFGVDPLLANYLSDSYLQAMEQVVKRSDPDIILFGQNDIGSDLAPRLAFRLKTGVALDCVDIKIDHKNDKIELVKPVFGGKAHSHFYIADNKIQIATIREGAFDPADYNESISGEVIPINLDINPSKVRTKLLRKETDESLYLALKLASASIVISGGRGLKEKRDIDFIQEIADSMGGAIGGSRPVVDNGWLPSSLQVGLTGRKVHPMVYIAVGISGALQHMAGCMKSKIIVAINKDEAAPIFKFSHFGVIGDYKDVLEGFRDEIKS